MLVPEFEGDLREALKQWQDVAQVQTFRESGYTDKPYGLRVDMTDGSAIWVQFLRTSPPGGSATTPDYYGVR